MRKSQVNIYPQESSEYVIAHAMRQKNRGRRPSFAYRGERNPVKALALAKRDKDSTKVTFQVNEKQWNVSINGAVAAQIHLDDENQVSKVVLISQEANFQRSVKELALSHAIQFVIRRSPILSSLLALAPKRDLEEYTCENLMNFDKVPVGVTKMSDQDLDTCLSKLANVVQGKFASPEEMLSSLLREIYMKQGILLGIRDAKWSHMDQDHIIATFETKNGHNFKIWNNSDGRGSSWRLHFTAPYHPVMEGKKSYCLINGSTDYYIRGGDAGIYRVFSPEEARAKKEGWGTSWSYINHPFYAEGKTLGIEFSSTLCMASTGYKTLYDLLCAALNQGDKYVAVSGGFQPPYDYPENVCNRKGIPSPAGNQGGGHRSRGSEHDCVWEYKTLEAEGMLDRSLAPDWFKREGWLDIYADEQPKFE